MYIAAEPNNNNNNKTFVMRTNLVTLFQGAHKTQTRQNKTTINMYMYNKQMIM